MATPVILPNNLAQAAQQQAMMEAQARAVVEGLACGIYEKLAVEEGSRVDSTGRDHRLRDHANYAVMAALAMGEKLGYCRRTPAAPPG